MNTIQKIPSTLLWLSLLISGLSACATQPETQSTRWTMEDSCTLPSQKQLTQALQSARNQLSQRSCHYQFDAIHQQLLTIAQQDPGPTHRQSFLDFYQWSVQQGIISSLQGKQLYTSYFTPGFGHLLPNNSNVCAQKTSQDSLIQTLNDDLAHKKLGLNDILQDRDGYFQAQRTHNDLIFLLETTLIACEQG